MTSNLAKIWHYYRGKTCVLQTKMVKCRLRPGPVSVTGELCIPRAVEKELKLIKAIESRRPLKPRGGPSPRVSNIEIVAVVDV